MFMRYVFVITPFCLIFLVERQMAAFISRCLSQKFYSFKAGCSRWKSNIIFLSHYVILINRPSEGRVPHTSLPISVQIPFCMCLYKKSITLYL